ncbi:MAG TPA: hypothetical protein VI997_07400 [Candidatus Thermoplasmatota archaeon]|nr:hypothetical protein [Candidatus Thermoplasmatota archaeon]
MDKASRERERDARRYAHPPSHRAAPVDRVLDEEADERPGPSPHERTGIERMEGEGGGSAPMHDAPEDGGDLRIRKRRP